MNYVLILMDYSIIKSLLGGIGKTGLSVEEFLTLNPVFLF